MKISWKVIRLEYKYVYKSVWTFCFKLSFHNFQEPKIKPKKDPLKKLSNQKVTKITYLSHLKSYRVEILNLS